MTDAHEHEASVTEAVARITAYLDARAAALAHIPPLGPGVIAGWPRTEDDADGDFELTATDQRTVLAALADCRSQIKEQYARISELETVSRGYCPECGRGDCAPTVEDWDRERKRADAAEKRVGELEAEREQPIGGNQVIGYEWGIRRDEDGIVTASTDERSARDLARRYEHRVKGLTVMYREVRHFVGHWREAGDARDGETDRSGAT